jgi:protein-disulfide isomerase
MAKTAKEKRVSEMKVVDVPRERANDSEYVTLSFKGLSLPWAILLGVIIFTGGMGSALYFGLRARPVTTVSATPTPTENQDPTALENFPEVTLPFVQGSTLGDKNAKVVILEFSDLVCPYCKKFHDESFGTINDSYVKTNKAAFVYKHYPLPFHNPAATIAAKAAYCMEKLYGEAKMFEFNDIFFSKTNTLTQNGYDKQNNPVVNIVDKTFYGLFAGLGADSSKIKTCMNSAEATARLVADAEELSKFQADLVAKNISQGLGTPSFVVGIVKDGVLSGRLIEGAYPIGAFQNVIEEQLKK